MAQQSPWSVKGVRPECRVAAKVAARRAGLTIGEWLNRAIMDAAKHSVQGTENTPVSHQLPALPLSELAKAIEALGGYIQKQGERSEKSTGLGRADMEESIAPMVRSVRRLEENVEAKFSALGRDIQRQGEITGKRAGMDRTEMERTLAPMLESVRRLQDNVGTRFDTLGERIQIQGDRMTTRGGLDLADVEETLAPVLESVRLLEEAVEAKFAALEMGDQEGPMQDRVREAEAKAERVNLSLAPLERKVMRLSQLMEQRQTDPDDDGPRRGLLSRLFGE